MSYENEELNMPYKKAIKRALALSSPQCTPETLFREWLPYFESHSYVKEYPCACGEIVAHGYFYVNKITHKELCMGSSCQKCLFIPRELQENRDSFNMFVFKHHNIKKRFFNSSTNEYETLVKAFVNEYVEKLLLENNVVEIKRFLKTLDRLYIRDVDFINNSMQRLNRGVRQHLNELEEAERMADRLGLCYIWIGGINNPY